jgi:DNA-binding MarR family transcriptional regulator
MTAIPEIGEGKRGAEGHLLYLLRQANAAARQAVDRELFGLRLTLSQYSALTMIAAYDGLSGADLASLSMLTPQSAHEVVSRLERTGFITRRADPRHKRIFRLELTEAGRAVLAEARRRTDRIEARLQALVERQAPGVVRQWLVDVAVEISDGAVLNDPSD